MLATRVSEFESRSSMLVFHKKRLSPCSWQVVPFLLIVSLGSSWSSRADDTPLVTLARIPAGTGSFAIAPDRVIPPSKEFLVHYPVPPGTTAGVGTLNVWPASPGDNCQKPAPLDDAQSYQLGMTLVKSGDEMVLEARVPALQIDQPFCFRVAPALSLVSEGGLALAVESARAFLQKVPQLDCDALQIQAFEDALRSGLGNPVVASIKDAAEPAHDHFIANHGAQLCSVYRGAQKAGELLGAALAKIPALYDQAARLRANAPDVDLPGLAHPFVLEDGKLADVRDLIVAGSSKTDLIDASHQLRLQADQDGQSASEKKLLHRWATALETLANATNGLHAAEEAVRHLDPAPSLRVWNGKDSWVTLKQYRKLHTDASEPLARYLVDRAPEGKNRTDWREALDELARVQGSIDALVAQVNDSNSAIAAAREKLRAAAEASFSADGVQRRLLVAAPVAGTPAPPLAGKGQTPTKANYVSVDVGAFVALAGGETWFLPYLGLNIYSVAVDRFIKPSLLVGTGMEQLRQRLSLTIGATLASPLTSRTIEQPFLSRYPIAALGYRLGEYSRIVAGGVFYELHDSNPASASKSLKVAAFAGVSLDADLIQFLTNAKL